MNNKAFLEFLHEARQSRRLFYDKKQWEIYLLGWFICLNLHKDVLENADNMRDFLRHKTDGAE